MRLLASFLILERAGGWPFEGLNSSKQWFKKSSNYLLAETRVAEVASLKLAFAIPVAVKGIRWLPCTRYSFPRHCTFLKRKPAIQTKKFTASLMGTSQIFLRTTGSPSPHTPMVQAIVSLRTR